VQEGRGWGRTSENDVTAADELSVDIDLGYCWPLAVQRTFLIMKRGKDTRKHAREFLNTGPQLRVREDVIGVHLGRGNTVEVKDLDDGPRETTLRCFRSSLHE